MSDLPGYDAWKTTEPDNEPWGVCDVCDRRVALDRLFTVYAYGLETHACADCCRDPDDERDRRKVEGD